MIELGGNIKLKGFSELDAATLIVVKKVVGNHTKKLSQDHPDFSELIIDLNKNDNNYNINANFTKHSEVLNSEAKGNNLFFTLSEALNGIKSKPKD